VVAGNVTFAAAMPQLLTPSEISVSKSCEKAAKPTASVVWARSVSRNWSSSIVNPTAEPNGITLQVPAGRRVIGSEVVVMSRWRHLPINGYPSGWAGGLSPNR